jgi:hypothetical protein
LEHRRDQLAYLTVVRLPCPAKNMPDEKCALQVIVQVIAAREFRHKCLQRRDELAKPQRRGDRGQ